MLRQYPKFWLAAVYRSPRESAKTRAETEMWGSVNEFLLKPKDDQQTEEQQKFVNIPSHHQCQTFLVHSLCVFKLTNSLHAPGLVFSPYLILNWAICALGGKISLIPLIWTDWPIHLFTSYFNHQSPSSNITGAAVDWGWRILGTRNWNVNLPIKISRIDSKS